MVIDFDLTMRRLLVCRAMSSTRRRASSAVGRPVDVSAVLVGGRFQLSEIAIEMSEGVFFDALGMIAESVAVGESGVAATIAGQQRIRSTA